MKEALTKRITDYLSNGGLFNPELANHIAVRDLLIECREALAQQCVCGEPNSAGTHRTDGPCLAPQPEQDPMAFDVKCDACEGNGLDWDDNNYKCVACSGLGFVDKLLYTTPPQRTWVWLTDEEERQIKEHCTTVACVLKTVKAKLKEKNT